MFLHIKQAKYLEDYKVDVYFNDGKRGVADLKDIFRGPVFEPLKNKDKFSKLYVDLETETIAWENGADLAPEYIYFKAFQDKHELQEQFKEWGYL